jgi:hypothetical protein
MTQVRREFIIVAVFLCFGFFLTYSTLPRHGEVVYNCSIAEISPDYPPEVKEKCRKLNIERYKNDHT